MKKKNCEKKYEKTSKYLSVLHYSVANGRNLARKGLLKQLTSSELRPTLATAPPVVLEATHREHEERVEHERHGGEGLDG